MSQKLLIVLSVAIFCNGVIYASPVNISEGALPEEKPPTAFPVTGNDHNKKIEPAQTPITPVIPKPSIPLNRSEIPGSVYPVAKSDAVAIHVIGPKNVTHDSVSKNETSVIDHKNSTLVTDGKNASRPIDTVTPVNGSKNATVPAGVPPSVTKSTLAPTPSLDVVPEKPTTPSTTTTTTTATTTTATITTTTNKTTETKAVVTTTTPNTTNTDKIHVAHDAVTPVQEKHFDGPSFIGGIVLTIGLTAIGFIAFKYYKAGKIDMNYRTL